jgi:phosphoglycerate dehydrogenase-like enzyme
VAYSPSRAGSAARDGVRFASDLHALLEQADVVSLHLPLSPQTRHVIGKVELAAMKRGAVLVNTARGALVDQNALVDALRGGQLGGAALDVQDPEPPGEISPLANIPTVLLTPHAAFDSVEAIAELQETAARNVAAVLAGGLPGTIVNPRVLETPVLRTSVPA